MPSLPPDFLRSEPYTSIFPSGDQTGLRSGPGSVVNRLDRPFCRSAIQMSAGLPRSNATYLPSPERFARWYSPGPPAIDSWLPFRSNQTNCETLLPAMGRYDTPPLVDTEKNGRGGLAIAAI